MANPRAMKAPDAAFSLGDDEDESHGLDETSQTDIRPKEQSGSNHAGDIPASSPSAPHDGPRVADKPLPISTDAAAASTQTSEASEGGGTPQLNGKHSPPAHVSPWAAAASGADPATEQATSAPASAIAVPASERPPSASGGPGPGVSKEGEEEEEQRIARELAALEAEAEALALQEQQQKGASAAAGKGAVESGHPAMLAGDPHAAEKAMAEAHRMVQEVNAGTTAMQSSLDAYAPRARPFSPPPGSAPLQRFSPVLVAPIAKPEAEEPPEFAGLLYWDGLDALGRPVIVVNADAVAEDKATRRAALDYMLHLLEPIVVQGPYVIVMVNNGRNQRSNRLPGSWFISAYSSLSRPFRKNVKHIVLVRPSKPLQAFLALLRPFVSRKAHRKVIKVESLSAIGEATGGEVTLAHLGQRFATAAGRAVSESLLLMSPTLRGGAEPPAAASAPAAEETSTV